MRVFCLLLLVVVASATLAPLRKAKKPIPGKYIIGLRVNYRIEKRTPESMIECPAQTYSYGNNCFFVANANPFEGIAAQCNEERCNARPVVISSQDENDFLQERLIDDGYRTKLIWIGYRYISQVDEYRWIPTEETSRFEETLGTIAVPPYHAENFKESLSNRDYHESPRGLMRGQMENHKEETYVPQ
ncbi:uncharacterized protein [Antedon mediterranea]|uniref:uncharacterized protein n=1 Tax=Antedon mediterranea TaxID=105859 RepID=UPI003AF82871